MPIYVRFETPKELSNKILEVVEKVKESGKICKGTNEVTKQVERGLAKLVVMAEDVSPEEILAHMPLLCEEKEVPYCYVPTREELGNTIELEVGSAAVAIIDPGKEKELLSNIIEEIRGLKE